ncbi:hypothetical protein VTK26DRAFT_4695 [Humicola hyalothermophila]
MLGPQQSNATLVQGWFEGKVLASSGPRRSWISYFVCQTQTSKKKKNPKNNKKRKKKKEKEIIGAPTDTAIHCPSFVPINFAASLIRLPIPELRKVLAAPLRSPTLRHWDHIELCYGTSHLPPWPARNKKGRIPACKLLIMTLSAQRDNLHLHNRAMARSPRPP